MDSCIDPPGYTNRDGYAIITRNKKKYLYHRWLWEQTYGPIPPGMYVLHICNNRRCRNINHYKLGSQRDNMKQCSKDGRIFKRGQHGMYHNVPDWMLPTG